MVREKGWRCKWQEENPKGGYSRVRYAQYWRATTIAEALGLGAKGTDPLHDCRHGYLKIFRDSLRVVPSDEEGTADGESASLSEPVSALLEEFARMRLVMLPKKGNLQDLNNWRGIMLIDAASKLLSMIVNDRLQRLLKEVGSEEQNGFTGGRGCSDGSFCIRQALKKRREHGLDREDSVNMTS